MNALEIVVRRARNNAWSNYRLHRACEALTREEWDATRTSFFPTIPATLNHILIVDWYYLDAMENGGRGRKCFDSEIPFPAHAPLAAAQRETDARLVAFAESLGNEAALGAKVRLDRGTHVQVETVGDVLMHVDAHQIHHRGQVHAMLSGTRVKPPQLDEFFLREELPLREAELRAIGLPLE